MSLTLEEKILSVTTDEEFDELFWEEYSADHRTFINQYLNESF